MKRILQILTLTCLLTIGTSTVNEVQAQCPMCKMSAESNLKAGGTAGKGLNMGILYLFATPYILVGTLGYIWWRNRRREDLDELLPGNEQLN